MAEIILKEEVYAIVGAAIEVYNQLGSGFLEAVYQEELEVEFALRNLPHQPQKELLLHYKGHRLKKEYIADFLCYDSIIVEIKALDKLTGKEEAQLINYLKATRLRVGLLINFGSANKLEWKRFVN
jgi:GxxExxY protein